MVCSVFVDPENTYKYDRWKKARRANNRSEVIDKIDLGIRRDRTEELVTEDKNSWLGYRRIATVTSMLGYSHAEC